MSYKIILTGATGMVGEGVLLACLDHPQIAAVLSVSRRSCGRTHPKLKEYIVPDFLALKEGDEQLKGYDACFFCAGVTSIGKKETEYTHLTYDTTLHFAQVLAQQNPQMVFIYVSGAGTDSSEKGKVMWARVKGKTENDLQKLPFRKVHNFRPAAMKLTEGQRNALPAYKYFAWMFPILKVVWPNKVSTLKQLGNAMINTLAIGSDKEILEVQDINALGDKTA
ncbi:MAG: epimerase [Chitinophagaceae bacterium]|nr:epimerase [Chitinophagaceae bacterium]